MPQVIFKEQVGSGLELQVIEGCGKVWVRANRAEPSLEAFWSAEGDGSSVEWARVAALVRERLLRFLQGHGSLDEAVLFWPEGWAFWGRGIPDPIADFVRYGE